MRRIYSVAMWIDAERYWQYIGEGSRAWAQRRADMARRDGNRVKMRATPQSAPRSSGRKAWLQFGAAPGPMLTVAADDHATMDAPRSGNTLSGYGNRLPTQHMVKYRNRWRRVHAICHSNCSTLYCRIDGARVIVSIDD